MCWRWGEAGCSGRSRWWQQLIVRVLPIYLLPRQSRCAAAPPNACAFMPFLYTSRCSPVMLAIMFATKQLAAFRALWACWLGFL